MSLKEKRMIIWSITAKVRQKFNVSINEFDALDVHQVIKLGVTCGSNSISVIDALLDQLVNFIDSHYETEITAVYKEII